MEEGEFVVAVRGLTNMTWTYAFINVAVANSWLVLSDVFTNCLGIDVLSVSSYYSLIFGVMTCHLKCMKGEDFKILMFAFAIYGVSNLAECVCVCVYALAFEGPPDCS